MTQPTTYGGRPAPPPMGAPAPELLVARFRGHARRLTWSALVLIAVAGATGYFYDNLPAGIENWMLFAAAAAIVVLLVVIPFLVWRGRIYTITTRRVIARRGMFLGRLRELVHERGYTIDVRRGILMRLWGAGTLTLSDGVDAPLRLVNVPSAELIREVLSDQIEVSQILAHRGAQAMPSPAGPTVP